MIRKKIYLTADNQYNINKQTHPELIQERSALYNSNLSIKLFSSYFQ